MLKNTVSESKGFQRSMVISNVHKQHGSKYLISASSTAHYFIFYHVLVERGTSRSNEVYVFYMLSMNVLQVSCGHISLVSCQTL